MTNEIYKLNKVVEYGLEVIKAKAIKAMFQPMLDKMEALEGEFNDVIKLEMSIETSALAKELRLKYVKVRTGTAEIHKMGKQSVLLEGRVYDGWKNAQLKASEGMESALMDIEKYAENLEKERIAELQEERIAKTSTYTEYPPDNLGNMPEQVWKEYLLGLETSYNLRIEAEKKAEKDRIAKEKAKAKENKRIRVENKRLETEAIERDRLDKIEADKRAKVETERVAKETVEREKREKVEKEQREAREKHDREVLERHEATVKKAREEAEAKLAQERKEKEIIEAELKAKAEKEKAEILANMDENIIKAITHGYDVAKYSIKTLDEAIESWINLQGE